MKLDLKCACDKKVISEIMMLHHGRYPKDVSRCVLQRIRRKAYGLGFRDLLGVEETMVVWHEPENWKHLAEPSKIQVSKDCKLKASNQ